MRASGPRNAATRGSGRWIGAAVCICCALGAQAREVGRPPGALGPAVVAREVIEALAVDGTARVLVAFDVPQLDESLARGAFDAKAVGNRIDEARERLLRGLGPGEFAIRHRYRHVNAMAGDVTAAGLLRLLAGPAVSRVDLDVGGTGHLNQARPLAGVDAVQSAGFTGLGVTVAVLDSGYDTDHTDLSDDLVAEACFCSGGGGCCPNGSPTQTGTGSAEDDNGHGTNVSGIITSRGTVAPIGGAPDAGVVAVKVLDGNNSFCCSSDVIAALDWIIGNRPDVDLVNMSLGTFALYTGDCDHAGASNMAFATAINTLRANGVTVFASSGNSRSGTQMPAPACIANAISVGAVWDSNVGSRTVFGCRDATTAADQVTCFSNSNATTDLFAPGAPTTSTGRGGGISTYFGTSQASPLATACAALLLEADPTLTPAEIEEALEASPTLVTDATNGLMFPRLDCLAALASLPPVALCRDITVSADPGLCGADASIDDGSFDPAGGAVTLAQTPSGPYPPGTTPVELTVTDDAGSSASCEGKVTVEDTEPPTIECDAPGTIRPPQVLVSFAANASDNCGTPIAAITGFDCFKLTKKGRRIDKTGSCTVSISDATITVVDSGGVDTNITWTVDAMDASGNVARQSCALLVDNPGKGQSQTRRLHPAP